jgi:hypothetical protein
MVLERRRRVVKIKIRPPFKSRQSQDCFTKFHVYSMTLESLSRTGNVKAAVEEVEIEMDMGRFVCCV